MTPPGPAARPVLPTGAGPAPVGADPAGRPVRFVALGDSLTEGLGDPRPGGGWRGWAALLADSLGTPSRQVHFVNAARSGALSTDAVCDQLAGARALRPQLASVLIGANDTLRASFDISRVAHSFDTVLRALHTEGAVLLTACLPDPGRMLRLPGPLARPLARRMRAVNEVVHELTLRYRAVHVHLADHPLVADRSAWSVDRLHPSERGHRLLAREFHTALADRGLVAGPPPRRLPDGPPPSRVAGMWWMATRGTRWAFDRSTDLLPGLLRSAAAEAVRRSAGARALDTAAHRAARAALAALPPPPPEAPAAPTPPAPGFPGPARAQLPKRALHAASAAGRCPTRPARAAGADPGGRDASPTPQSAPS